MRDKYANVPNCPPHRQFKIGSKVLNGAHDSVIVTGVSKCGRIYDLEVTNDRARSHEKVPRLVTEKRTVAWTEVLPLSSEDFTTELHSDPKYYPLSYQQRDMFSLICMIYSEYGFDFDPDYQRGYVWKLEDKVALIDSIMAQRDIGKFVINSRAWHDTLPLDEVIDGKQRLSAIKEFYEDGFRYKGKLYSELHPHDRGTFDHKAVSVASLENASRKEILATFLAVNITGRQQNLEHLEYVKQLMEKNNA